MRCLWENKKTSEKSVFREAWSREVTSQSFPVPCFWSRGFARHRKWNLMLLVHQNTGKENRYGKNFFAVLISTLGRFDRANKKNLSYTLWESVHERITQTWHMPSHRFLAKFHRWLRSLSYSRAQSSLVSRSIPRVLGLSNQIPRIKPRN